MKHKLWDSITAWVIEDYYKDETIEYVPIVFKDYHKAYDFAWDRFEEVKIEPSGAKKVLDEDSEIDFFLIIGWQIN